MTDFRSIRNPEVLDVGGCIILEEAIVTLVTKGHFSHPTGTGQVAKGIGDRPTRTAAGCRVGKLKCTDPFPVCAYSFSNACLLKSDSLSNILPFCFPQP